VGAWLRIWRKPEGRVFETSAVANSWLGQSRHTCWSRRPPLALSPPPDSGRS